jgi:hypothetical protein
MRWIHWAAAVSVLLSVAAVAGVLLFRDPGPGDLPPSEELVRQGARPLTTRYGDLDGDGLQEIVIASVSEEVPETGLPTPYLEVFDHRDGDWVRVFDGTGHAPPGADGTPETMLQPAGQEFVGQSISVLDVVDFEGDRTPEVVAAVTNAGATAGPLDLWIVSMTPDGRLQTEFFETTSRGGRVDIAGSRLFFEYGVYRPDDPGCCPSLIQFETIGFDRAAGRIRVVESSRIPAGE